jgi:hypothetical protein
VNCASPSSSTSPIDTFSGARHARKARLRGGAQLQLRRVLDESDRRRLVAGHDGVAAEQRARVASQRGVESVGQESHRRERRHRQHDRHHQQAQLAGAQVALQLSPRHRDDTDVQAGCCSGRHAATVHHGAATCRGHGNPLNPACKLLQRPAPGTVL